MLSVHILINRFTANWSHDDTRWDYTDVLHCISSIFLAEISIAINIIPASDPIDNPSRNKNIDYLPSDRNLFKITSLYHCIYHEISVL